MPTVKLLQKELADIASTYGEVYDTDIGQVSFTRLTEPKGFVLQARDDQLRFYMYKKLLPPQVEKLKSSDSPLTMPKPENRYGIWEHIWSVTTWIKAGMPISEELMKYKVAQGFKAGLKLLDDPEKFAADILNAYAETGTHVHGAMEDLVNGLEVTIAGRSKKEQNGIIAGANFINDFKIRNAQTEQIVIYDMMHKLGDKMIRVVYAGTLDLVVEIYNDKLLKFETWLIDYKTSKAAHPSHAVQVMALGMAIEQCRGIHIDRYGVLLLGKQTVKGYQLVEIGKERNWPWSFDDVLDVYKMAMRVEGGKLPEPKYRVFPTKIKLTEDKDDVPTIQEKAKAS